jgi:hypothetical protein
LNIVGSGEKKGPQPKPISDIETTEDILTRYYFGNVFFQLFYLTPDEVANLNYEEMEHQCSYQDMDIFERRAMYYLLNNVVTTHTASNKTWLNTFNESTSDMMMRDNIEWEKTNPASADTKD